MTAGPMRERLLQFIRRAEADQAETLEIRLYRLYCLTTALLCLVVIFPINLFQNLPVAVNAGVVAMGFIAAVFYWRSLRGVHWVTAFFVVLVLVVDPIWFLNAGSEGSVSFYLFPLLLYPLAVFNGWRRWVFTVGFVANFCVLVVLEYNFPFLSVPFKSQRDRVMDLWTGILCSSIGMTAVAQLIVAAYQAEHVRLKRFAQELAASEGKYREIFNSTSEALFIYSLEGDVFDLNEAACVLLGGSREALLGEMRGGSGPYLQARQANVIDRALREGPQSFVWTIPQGGGRVLWFEGVIRHAAVGGQSKLIVAVRDITSHRMAEEALRLNEGRLRLALEASNQGWFDLNVVTGEGTASGEYARIIGLEPVEFKVTAKSWLEGVHPDDRETMAREFRLCVAEGGPRTMEYRRRAANGEWKWIRSTGKIVERDDSGAAVRMMGTHADITERKKLEAQLFHSQRLESVGTLAGGVAHDLNNILTPMLMAGEMLREKLDDPEDQQLMSQMEAGARRGAGIVRQLLTFSRELSQTRAHVDMRQILNEMADIARATFPREIEISSRVPDDLWTVAGDPVQLHQVVMNLCINARDAMPQGGMLSLSGRNLVRGDSSERFVVITVQDTGEGIAPENLSRIFDPFFTTKGVGKGTGLGLSTVHGIVKSHRGVVTVDSEVRHGSSFHVTLPAVMGSAVAAAVKEPALPRHTGRLNVLVVDDDEAVLSATQRALQAEGFQVTAARRGDDALALAMDRSCLIDLVVTDVMMPGLDGLKLVPALLRERPSVPVLGVSGLEFEARRDELRSLGFSEILRKPYDAADLLRAVRRLLPPS